MNDDEYSEPVRKSASAQDVMEFLSTGGGIFLYGESTGPGRTA
jgi:hypothetical protein